MADILLIDDDRYFRQVMVLMLVKAGHQVREAEDGIEALLIFRRHQPEIVITDVLMPSKEGIELIRDLRHDAPDLPIIAMSGSDQSDLYLHTGTAMGATAVLTKPFKGEELLQLIDKLLSA